jgi:hypothetical protein
LLRPQSHFKEIPSGLGRAETKLMERRRRETIRTMDAMSVLDIAQGVAEREGGSGGNQTKQRKKQQFDDF